MLELRKKFTLQPHEFKRLLAIMRASDILENGANKDRRDLRGVPVEDLPTTIRFMEYKFRIDGFQDVMDVVEAVKRVFHDRDGGKVAAQRPSDPGIPAFDAIVEEARHFRILEGLIDLMHPDMVTGARAFLSRLMQKPAQGKPVPLFIASGALNPILQSYLRVCGLEESAFREIAGSPQAKHVAIGHALEATRGDPGVVVMVGDARKDREEAEHPDLPKNDIAFIARLDGSGEDMGATLGAPDFNGMDWDPESRTLTFTNAFTGRTIALVVRAFVFDADGTLFDTQPLADEAIRRHGADMLGIPLGHPDYESLRTIGERLARETRGFSDQEIMRLIYDEILAYYARQKEAERPHDFAARSGYRWAAGTEISTALGLAGIIYGMDLHSLGGWFALMTVGLYGTLAALSFYLIAKVTHELMGSTKDPIAASDNPDGTRGSRADPFRALEYYAGQSRFYRWVTDSIEYHESFQNHILGMLAMLPGVHFMIDNARNQAEALDMAA
jgi:phosphoglycolate phosphatase-like HAD superfamily hydrolase